MIKENKFNIKPYKKNVGAEIICSLRLVKKKEIKLIKNSLNKYGVIFFRNQNLDSKSYVSFAKKLGNCYHGLKSLAPNKKFQAIVEFEILNLT